MGEYSKKGSYAGYDKDHDSRADLDYYATPPEEVENILEIEGLDYSACSGTPVIWEPCCGGGHMAEGVLQYLKNDPNTIKLILTDLVDRGAEEYLYNTPYWGEDRIIYTAYDIDLLTGISYAGVDYIIMNPPFKDIDKFVNAVLPCATHKLIMLARLKFIESQKRYEQIFSKNPPTRVYQYIDRIACYKDGDFSIKPNSIEAYAWFVWDKDEDKEGTELKWIWSKKHK